MSEIFLFRCQYVKDDMNMKLHWSYHYNSYKLLPHIWRPCVSISIAWLLRLKLARLFTATNQRVSKCFNILSGNNKDTLTTPNMMGQRQALLTNFRDFLIGSKKHIHTKHSYNNKQHTRHTHRYSFNTYKHASLMSNIYLGNWRVS